MNTRIIVKLQHEAIHHWPECPIEDVKFLRDKHRHVFHICAKKLVTHNDRDIEIIMLKREMQRFLQEIYQKDFGRMSCEDIAHILIKQFDLSYCSVLEDNENGAEIEV